MAFDLPQSSKAVECHIVPDRVPKTNVGFHVAWRLGLLFSLLPFSCGEVVKMPSEARSQSWVIRNGSVHTSLCSGKHHGAAREHLLCNTENPSSVPSHCLGLLTT